MSLRSLPPFLLMAAALYAQATIEGTVINSATHAGIDGVRVRFFSPQGSRYETSTTVSGTFRIEGVREGNYLWNLQKSGFESRNVRSMPLVRVASSDTTRLTLELLPSVTLAGRVIDPEGNPVAGASVGLRADSEKSLALFATTAPDGTFTFKQVVPGTFTLSARPQPGGSVEQDGIRTEPIATDYPRPIIVSGIADETGFDIRLRRSPVYRVRGVVLDEGGHPLPDVSVQLVPAKSNQFAALPVKFGKTEFHLPWTERVPLDEGVLTNSGGVFEFPSVVGGDWRIRASTKWSHDETSKRDTQKVGEFEVVVSRRDIDGLEIRLAANVEVPVINDWPENAQPSPTNIRLGMVTLVPLDGNDVSPFMGEQLLDSTRPNGGARFNLYPGRYIVVPLMTSDPRQYVAQVLWGGRDILGEPITFGASAPPLRIVYKKGAGIVKGTLEKNATGTVVLIPTAAFDAVRSTEVGAGEIFQFGNLRPGQYSVVAFDRVNKAKLADRSFLPDFMSLATRIKLEESGNTSVELRVNHWPD